MENTLQNVKQVIINNIALLKKADTKSTKNIEDFFEFVTSIPLVKLYTKEGVAVIEDKLYNTTVEYQSEVVEFLLRIKPDVVTIEYFDDVCKKFLQNDNILDKLYIKKEKDAEENEFTKLDINKIEDYYLLNLILAFNTVIL